ncbi:hypothetical protein [Nonomuraea sp. NPDC048916]|uniref:hypothetical protein n=1 Tax=Nonomuraea sp. NPDC048916 TaxID=3154232 RepID=UPI0033C3CF54
MVAEPGGSAVAAGPDASAVVADSIGRLAYSGPEIDWMVRYGQGSHERDPVTRTFEEALSDRDGEHLLVVLEGANHFTLADPVDRTAARAFLDLPATSGPRPELAGLITAFLGTHLHEDARARTVLDGVPGVRRR